MTGWWLLATLAVAVLVLALLTANVTVVYLVHGHSWRRPLRVGITDAEGWDNYTHCAHPTQCRAHRLCCYLSGRDQGSRSVEWWHEVDWGARPKRWPAIRRRHRVLYLTVPWRGLALTLERTLIRHYRPARNVHHVPADELARRRHRRHVA